MNPVQQLIDSNTQSHIRFGPHPEHDNTSVGSETTLSYAGSITDPQLLMLPYTAPNAIRIYNEELTEYRKFILTETALRNMIINATDDQYINALKDRRTLYTTVSPLELLKHLVDEYGEIEDEDRTANEERMKASWNPPEPIETLFTQLKEGQAFAGAAFETITDDQIVRWGFDIIKATRKFDSSCIKWKDRKRSEKTWKDFKSFFRKAYKHIRAADEEEKKEETTAMYTANQVQEILKQEMDSFVKQLEDRENVNPNVPTCQPVQETANAVSGLTADDVIKILAAAQGNNGYRRRNNNRGNDRINRSGDKPEPQGTVDGHPIVYCWTHGVTKNLWHTSCRCTRQREGHKTEATYTNQMGGSKNVFGRKKE